MPMQLPKPHVFIFMGLIASGKSTLAQAFADKYQLQYYNSDIERKELARVELTSRGTGDFGKGIYSPEFTRLTYDALIAKGKAQVAESCSVVLDGSYAKRAERQHIRAAFAATDAKLVFILCEVSEQVTRERLQQRALDKTAVSDGTFAIYTMQKKGFQYPDELDPAGFITIETDGEVEQLLTILESSLKIAPFSS